MYRFFVSPECMEDERVRLTGDVAHQIGRVLRMKPGDRIVVLDNRGGAYVVALQSFSSDVVTGRIVGPEEASRDSEPDVRVSLYQALLKGRKMELILQKGTEIGMAGACFFSSERSERRRPGRLYESKQERWRAILREAAEQSRRRRLPDLLPPLEFPEVVERVSQQADSPGMIAVVDPTVPSLASLLRCWEGSPPVSAAVLIGPEGGFDEAELALAREAGLHPFWLGPRVLRAETAPLVVLSVLLYAWGQME